MEVISFGSRLQQIKKVLPRRYDTISKSPADDFHKYKCHPKKKKRFSDICRV